VRRKVKMPAGKEVRPTNHPHPTIIRGSPERARVGPHLKISNLTTRRTRAAGIGKLLRRYGTLVYTQSGNFQEAVTRLKLDRRTVKSKIDHPLLQDLTRQLIPRPSWRSHTAMAGGIGPSGRVLARSLPGGLSWGEYDTLPRKHNPRYQAAHPPKAGRGFPLSRPLRRANP
jgi:hypothetical protein